MRPFLSTELGDLRRFDGFIPGATLGVEEPEQFLQNGGVGSVAKEGALTLYFDELFVFELFEVVRQRGRRNSEFALDLTDHHSVRMRGKQSPQDPQARLGAERGEHVRIVRCAVDFRRSLRSRRFHISIILELWNVSSAGGYFDDSHYARTLLRRPYIPGSRMHRKGQEKGKD